MFCDNNADRLRKEVLIHVAQSFFAEDPHDSMNRIPLKMRPRDAEASRCCVYSDRQVLKYRCMAALGFGVEDEIDELTTLGEYFDEALTRKTVENNVLTVLDIACSACVQSKYLATEACVGCVAHPCMLNCPKHAIQMIHGKAHIDSDLCVSCGICQKVCPYHAIIRIPIPCEEACPVNAITKDVDGREVIDHDACIYCGKCAVACPFGAVAEKSQMIDVLKALKMDRDVVVMPAPSIVGQLPGTMKQLVRALEMLGFSRVIEVAVGADMTAKREANEWIEKGTKGQSFMTTSCCPSYIEAVKKHASELLPYVSDTDTPMVMTAKWIKKRSPDSVTVFVGPCMAKRKEGMDEPSVDFVLTFDELGAMLIACNIDVAECDEEDFETPASSNGRSYPVSGGVAAAVKACLPENEQDVSCEWINGIDKKTMKLLNAYPRKNEMSGLLEVMGCEGGCVAGPRVLVPSAKAARQVRQFAAERGADDQ